MRCGNCNFVDHNNNNNFINGLTIPNHWGGQDDGIMINGRENKAKYWQLG